MNKTLTFGKTCKIAISYTFFFKKKAAVIVNTVSKALQFYLCFSRDSFYHREGKISVVSG